MLKKLQKHLLANKRSLQFLNALRNCKIIYLIILTGTFVWSLTMIRSGLAYDFGIGYWGPNGHDGVWHLSLARSLANGSLNLPIFAGGQITNYHIGFDLILAFVNKITFIPISVLYFQIFPPIIAFSLGFLIFKFLKIYKFKDNVVIWSLFFVYFGGNFGWLITLLRDQELAGSSMFWAQANVQTLINPPFALSLVFILSGLILIQNKKYILSAILFGLLIQIKVYAAVIVIGALFITGIYVYLLNKKTDLLKTFFVSVIISLLIFLPFNRGASSLIVFKPFWFLETMMSFPDRFGWQRFGEAMINYKLAGNWVKGILAYFMAFVIFLYGNLGTRFIAEIYVLKFKKKKPKDFEVFFMSAILIGLILPMLFVQKGTAWNTIQFFYYSLFFASILSGIVFAGILNTLKSKLYKGLLVVGVLFFTLPTTFDLMKHYLPQTPPAMISNTELEALNLLKDQPSGIVLIPAFDRELGQYAPAPRPLYLYESTSYVSAYTGKQVFLEDEVNLDITGFNWQKRQVEVENYFNKPNKEFLEKNNISYVYLPKAYNFKLDLPKIFENEEVSVFRIN